MISVGEARARILAALTPVSTETIPLSDALHRVLAAPVVARLTQPPADVSAMDGYALRAADTGPRRVIGTAPAGHPYAGTVGRGEAIRIFTGSVVPTGADAILIQESATLDGNTLHPTESPSPGQFIRRAGQDFAQCDTLLTPGQRLTPFQLGLAAAANHPYLTVFRRPCVAILATGDELAHPGEPIPPGGIIDANAHLLAALIRAAGATPTILPIAADTPEAIAAAVKPALGVDLLITTGGASVGAHDAVQAGLAQHGFALDFWKIAMRPGKPLISGHIGATPVLGLPGNPVSAAVTAALFALPAIARLSGLTDTALPTRQARTTTKLRTNDQREDYLRATLTTAEDGTLLATPHPRQDSALLRLLAIADCLLIRPPHAAAVEAGAAVEVIMLNSRQGLLF